jgi:X-Pro dipeptidyl-peptidase C-terminal non-catalytic domain
MAGEPYTSTEAKALTILQDDKSAIGIPMPAGGPAPTAIQSGWTDTLFPVSEALHYANAVHAAGDHTPLLLMFDDVGHGWAQGKAADQARTNQAGIAFLDAVMLGHRQPQTGVIAIAQTCPTSAPSGPETTGASLSALAPMSVVLRGASAQTVRSDGGDPSTAAALDPAYHSPLCHPLPAAAEPGTATYQAPVGQGFTLLGGATITARLHVVGNYPELVGRLWDVGTDGTRQIVAMGVFRPSVNQSTGTSSSATGDETVRFELNPNEYHFAAGHHVELELVGSNAPYFRASNGTFSITVTGLRATLPVS